MNLSIASGVVDIRVGVTAIYNVKGQSGGVLIFNYAKDPPGSLLAKLVKHNS